MIVQRDTYFVGTVVGYARLTCMRSMESDRLQAWWMRCVCSMYSEILCRKLRGSLNTTGMAIFDSSCSRRQNKQQDDHMLELFSLNTQLWLTTH